MIYLLEGNNFSGRSEFLRLQAKDNGVYLGEQASNYLTGLFPLVTDEINFHSSGSVYELRKYIQSIFLEIGFDNHFNKSPFVLSGGEQVILAILSNLLLSPQILSIDNSLEMLSYDWRNIMLSKFNSNKLQTSIYISDNRLTEFRPNNLPRINDFPNVINKKYSFEKPKFIDISLRYNSANVSIKNLQFNYNRSNVVFENLNVELQSGNIYHLSGSNGSGKSTLAKILSGILKINSNNIYFNGKICNPYLSPGSIFGYSFQNPDEQLFSDSVEDEILKYQRNELDNHSLLRDSYITMFGLQNVRKLNPAELPFVLRKRISIAATLCLDRPWYIFDEPTLGQDDEFVDFFKSLINYLSKAGRGIIIISHSTTLFNELQYNKLLIKNCILQEQ